MHTETIRIPVAEGVEIAADIAGRRGAPTVILGHGGGQTRHSWDRAEHQLAQAGYFAINYDLRGHGDSDWSPDGDYDITTRAHDLMAVAAQGAEPLALVGASLGGIDSPDARTKNVAAGRRTRCSLRSSLPSMWSSAGLGKPASTGEPNNGSSSGVGHSTKRSTFQVPK